MQQHPKLTHRTSLCADDAAAFADGFFEDVTEIDVAETPPLLRELLDLTAVADRALARAVTLLMRAQTTGEVEAETGLPVEAWLAQVGRMLRVDRTFLTVAADVLSSMPGTLACFGDGTLSWSQVRAIVTAVRGLRAEQRTDLDAEIAAAAHEFTSWDPEQIVWRVDLLAAEFLDTSETAELGEEPDRPADTLVLQPRLDGMGGKLWGDYWDPVAFGTIENALSEKMDRPDALEPSTDHDARRRNADRLGQARADALTQICRDSLAGDHGAKPAKPLLLATASLDTLLGLSNTPGHLLTRMTGGRLKLDATSLRRLVNEGGAQVRTIVLDDVGQAVGVGRKSYVPPGWLRETILALQHECGTPGCRTAARLCDLDHVEPWPDGPTDADNLQPLCRRHHREKTRSLRSLGRRSDQRRFAPAATDGVWQVEVLQDGTRRHRHVPSGLTTDVPLTSFAWTSPRPASLRSGDRTAGAASRRRPT